MLENIITSLLAFVSTNIDDIFILMLFYGRRNQKSINIVLGQYLGIGTLVLISFVGAAIGSLMDQMYIGLLGLFPIYLALKNVLQQEESDDEVPMAGMGIISISGVTIANGGDNIGVYVPLLTTMTVIGKVCMVVVFAIMTYAWCMAARYLARHPVVARYLDRFGNVITPLVLFALGVFILWESRSFFLFFK
jgi:cadmium resistance protein CadD (predicted permease)